MKNPSLFKIYIYKICTFIVKKTLPTRQPITPLTLIGVYKWRKTMKYRAYYVSNGPMGKGHFAFL